MNSCDDKDGRKTGHRDARSTLKRSSSSGKMTKFQLASTTSLSLQPNIVSLPIEIPVMLVSVSHLFVVFHFFMYCAVTFLITNTTSESLPLVIVRKVKLRIRHVNVYVLTAREKKTIKKWFARFM